MKITTTIVLAVAGIFASLAYASIPDPYTKQNKAMLAALRIAPDSKDGYGNKMVHIPTLQGAICGEVKEARENVTYCGAATIVPNDVDDYIFAGKIRIGQAAGLYSGYVSIACQGYKISCYKIRNLELTIDN